MRQIRKTLYILQDGYYLHCDHGALLVRTKNNDDSHLIRISAETLEQIVLFANCTISDYLVKFCNDNQITLTFVSKYGSLYGRIIGANHGNIILRKKQYDLDNERIVTIVSDILLGKLSNERNILKRAAKDAPDHDADVLYESAEKIRQLIPELRGHDSIDSLRGIEGAAATIYFTAFDHMLKTKDKSMLFVKRSRRPPENNCNAVLSLLYTLFMTDCEAALENSGLDSYYGYLHTMRSGRPSLACDLLEEFRSCFIDRFVITLINRRQITAKDFENAQRGIRFKDDSLKRVLGLWEDYKTGVIEYPLDHCKYERKIIPYLQGQLMAQFIRGDIDEYPPFSWR